MAGLNNIISNSAVQTTTMPTWFDTAQQNVVNKAGDALIAAPTPQSTVAQGAVNQLSGPTNAFTNATGTLQDIASGAANPWITDASGNVTPNTNTAMGGLFQAQNQQLNQLMPQYTAPVDAASIASGNFGGLRGDTAYNKAMADAQANLFAQQNTAALQNQQTGVQAGSAVGNVAQQGINNALTVGQYQQAAPFANVSNYGKVIGGVQAPTTVTNQTQLSPLNQVMGAINLMGGSTGSGGVLGQLFGTGTKGQAGYTPGLIGSIGGLLGLGAAAGSGGSGSGITMDANGNPTPGSYPLADGGTLTVNNDGSQYIAPADSNSPGLYVDASGTPYTGSTNDGNPAPTIDPSMPTDTTGGGYTSSDGTSVSS